MACVRHLSAENTNTFYYYFQSWGGVLKTMACVRHKSTEDTDAFDQEIKRTSDILDQPRPRFYGFADWKMYKDYNKRMCVKKHFATRMRLNAIRKNTILPQELQVCFQGGEPTSQSLNVSKENNLGPGEKIRFMWSLKGLGPVVQSIVSLMSSLRGQLVKCFMTL